MWILWRFFNIPFSRIEEGICFKRQTRILSSLFSPLTIFLHLHTNLSINCVSVQQQQRRRRQQQQPVFWTSPTPNSTPPHPPTNTISPTIRFFCFRFFFKVDMSWDFIWNCRRRRLCKLDDIDKSDLVNWLRVGHRRVVATFPHLPFIRLFSPHTFCAHPPTHTHTYPRFNVSTCQSPLSPLPKFLSPYFFDRKSLGFVAHLHALFFLLSCWRIDGI